jgi:excisionase family DNA binding protein
VNNYRIKDLIKEVVHNELLINNWFDVVGACKYAKCSRTTLFKVIRDGKLKSSKPKGVRSIKIRKDWLDEWLDN